MGDELKPPSQSEMIRQTWETVTRLQHFVEGNGRKGLLSRMDTAEMKIHLIYAVPVIVVAVWATLVALGRVH